MMMISQALGGEPTAAESTAICCCLGACWMCGVCMLRVYFGKDTGHDTNFTITMTTIDLTINIDLTMQVHDRSPKVTAAQVRWEPTTNTGHGYIEL